MSFFKTAFEQIKNLALSSRVGGFEIKSKNSNNYLGSFWEIISPLIQIGVYWFVFTSIMQRTDIEVSSGQIIPYIEWMLLGYVVWIFAYKSIIDGSSSMYSRMGMLQKLEYPLASVPMIPIFNHLKTHLKLLIVAIVIIGLSGGITVSLKLLQLVYIVPFMFIFLVAVGLVTSTVSMLIRDFHQLLTAIMKVGLYISPVLWQVTMIGGEIGNALRYNPLNYFIETYRAAIFGTEWYAMDHLNETIVICIVTLVIYIMGATMHQKLKRDFSDLA